MSNISIHYVHGMYHMSMHCQSRRLHVVRFVCKHIGRLAYKYKNINWRVLFVYVLKCSFSLICIHVENSFSHVCKHVEGYF